MFGIPLAPGSLNGFSLLITLFICSPEIGAYSNVLFGYMNTSLVVVCSSLGAGKKVLKSILALSSFVFAVHVVLSPRFVVSAGTLALLPSDASADAYLCAVQMVFSFIHSRKSSQWSFFDFLMVFMYLLHAILYFWCASSIGSFLFV